MAQLKTTLFFGLLFSAFLLSAQNNGWHNYSKTEEVNVMMVHGAAVYCGTPQGLVKIDKQTQKTTFYTIQNSDIPSNNVTSLASTANGLWVGTDRGLALYNNSGWEVYTGTGASTFTNPITALYADTGSTLWVAERFKFYEYEYDNDKWSYHGTVSGNISDVIRDGEGNLWLSTAGTGKGIYEFENGSFTQYSTGNSDLPHNEVNDMDVDTLGRLWLATNNGAASFSFGQFSTLNTGNSDLTDNAVLSVSVDPWTNDKWFGVGGWQDPGLDYYDGTNWTHYDRDNSGLIQNRVNAGIPDSLGGIWVGTGDAENSAFGGLNRFDGNSWFSFNVSNSGLPSNWITDAAVKHGHGIWVASSMGLSHFDSAEWRTFDILSELGMGNYTTAVEMDTNGHPCFGTFTGFGTMDDDTNWSGFTTADGLVHNTVNCIDVGPDNKVWIGTFGGLSVWDGKSFKNYTTADGLPGNNIGTIDVAEDGSVLVGNIFNGGTQMGAAWWVAEDDTFRGINPSTMPGFPTVQVNDVAVADSVLGFATPEGLVLVNREKMEFDKTIKPSWGKECYTLARILRESTDEAVPGGRQVLGSGEYGFFDVFLNLFETDYYEKQNNMEVERHTQNSVFNKRDLLEEYIVLLPTNGTGLLVNYRINLLDTGVVSVAKMQDQFKVKLISVYPNPAYQDLTVQSLCASSQPLELELSDLFGRRVHSRVVNNACKNGGTVIDLSSLPAGVYLIKAQQGDFTEVVKFVKH